MTEPDDKPPAPTYVKGELLHFSDHGVFVYAYRCVRCGGKFHSTAPESSEPVLCRGCFHGIEARRER